MTSFEKLEFENDPDIEQPFFLPSKYPEFKYRFWVGPSNTEQALSFKKIVEKSRVATRHDMGDALHQEMDDEREFSDPRHERFYKAMMGEGPLDAYTEEDHWKYSEKLEADLKALEGRMTMQIAARQESEKRDRSQAQAELQRLCDDYESSVRDIQIKIQELEGEKRQLELNYNNNIRHIENKRMKTEGLYCSRCHLPWR